MSALLYILRKTIKNGVKQMIKRKAALFAYVIFIALMAFNTYNISKDGQGQEILEQHLQIYIISMTVLVMLTFLPSVYQAVSKFSANFKLADVYLVFTGPIHPAKVLLYAQIKQMGSSVFASFFLLLQAPLLMRFLGIGLEGIFIFMGGWLMMFLTFSPICLAIFTLSMKWPWLKKIVKYIVYFTLVICIGYVLVGVLKATEPLNVFLERGSSSYFSKIPVIGWYRVLFEAALYGITTETVMAFIGIMVLFVGSLIVMFKFATTDYYEDAISVSEQVERVRKAMQSGRTSDIRGLQNKKVKEVIFSFKGKGAKVLLEKQLLEIKKRGMFLFDAKSVLLIFLIVVIGFLVPQSDEIASLKFLVSIGVIAYLLFLISISYSNRELELHYIYLIPDGSFAKLIYLTLLPSIKMFIDTLIGFTIVTIVFRESFIHAILCSAILFVFMLIHSFVDLIAGTLFGNIHTNILKVLLKMFITILVLIPGITILILFGTLKWPMSVGLTLFLIANISVTALLALPASLSVRQPEYNI